MSHNIFVIFTIKLGCIAGIILWTIQPFAADSPPIIQGFDRLFNRFQMDCDAFLFEGTCCAIPAKTLVLEKCIK